jgi:hypothetical protein
MIAEADRFGDHPFLSGNAALCRPALGVSVNP